MADPRNIFDFWSRIDTLELAQEAAKGGFAAAMVCAAVTAVLAIAGYFGFSLLAGFGLFALIDAAIFAGLGWGIYRYSRVCAVLALLFYCAEQYNNVVNASSIGAVLVFLFLVFYLRAVRGTIAYHRIRKRKADVRVQPPDKSPGADA